MSIISASPRLDILVPTYGNITAGHTPRFHPIQAAWSGNVFARGNASINGIEVADGFTGYMSSLAFGGEWKLYCAGGSFFYMADGQGNSHLQERSYSLVDKTCMWEVLLTQKVFKNMITVGQLLQELADGATVVSNIGLSKLIDPADTMDSMGSGDTTAERQTYTVSNSTYLAEVNRILSWYGYVVYADPADQNNLTILAPVQRLISGGEPVPGTPSRGIIEISSEDFNLLGAEYTIDYGGIHSDVVVASNETGKGAAVGASMVGQSLTAYREYVASGYNISKRFNPLFATVYRVTDLKLKDVALAMLATDRRAAQTLVITSTSILPSPLWKDIAWTDRNGNGGTWRVTGFNVSLAGIGGRMSLECMPI
jgi:hypothetical protein